MFSKLLKSLGILIMCFIMCACTYENIKISNKFSSEQIEELIIGANGWCDVGVRCFDITIVPDSEANVSFGIENCKGKPPPGVNACRLGRKIFFSKDIELDKVRVVFAHELGHIIRRKHGHLSEEGNVMFEHDLDADQEITELDVAFVLRSKDAN